MTATNGAGAVTATSGATSKVDPVAPAEHDRAVDLRHDPRRRDPDRRQGAWTGTPTISYAYQWRRCDTSGASCADIAGATGTSYRLTSADANATIRVVVTAANGAGSTPATTAASARVAAAPPVNTAAPAISGTTRDGGTLTADRGTWTGTPTITYAYQWRRCDAAGANCADIANATNATYTLTSADVGTTTRVVVTASNTAGTATATAAQSAQIDPRRAGQHDGADDRGHDARRPDPHGRPRHVDRNAGDHLRLPVARCDATARTAPTSRARRRRPTR